MQYFQLHIMQIFKILILGLSLFLSALVAGQSLTNADEQMQLGRVDLAIEMYNKLLNTSQSKIERYNTHKQLSLAYFTAGSRTSAVNHMNQAYTLNRQLFDEFSDERAAIYSDWGLVNSFDKPQLALEQYQKSKDIYAKKYGKSNHRLVTSYINIGVMNIHQQDYSTGIENLNKGLKINTDNKLREAFIFTQLGSAYLSLGKPDLAEGYELEALEIYKEKFGDKHSEIAQIYNNLGSVDLYRKDYKEALNHYQLAIKANAIDFKEENYYALPVDVKTLNPTLFLNTVHLKAQAFESLYFGKTLKRRDLKSAQDHLNLCDELFDGIRRAQPDESDKLSLSHLGYSIFEDAVKVNMELSDVSILKKKYQALAYYYAEKSKASILLDAIQDSKAKEFAGLPRDILEKEKSLKAKLILIRKQLAKNRTEALETTLLATNRAYNSLIKNIEADYPKYYSLKFKTKTPYLKDVQEKLPVGETIVQYFVDETSQVLYTFVITQKKYRVSRTKINHNLKRNLIGFSNAITYGLDKYEKSLGLEVADEILPKLPKTTDHIVFIPTAFLNKIPFEVLSTKQGYLVEKYQISYHYTASLHLESLKEIAASPSICMIAPVEFTDEDMPTLLGTLDEVKGIESLYKAKNYTSSSFVREKAGKTVLQSKELKEASIIHFATHGEVNEKEPDLSKLLLWNEVLYAGEIYNQEFNSSLVTISACETGLGKSHKGEGVMGLSRALIYAGANSLLVSYWKVDDKATDVLMNNFYAQVITGKTYPEALRLAKLNLINSKYNSPRYWAAFVLIGK